MRGLYLFENQNEANLLLHSLWSAHGISNVDSLDIYELDSSQRLQQYDYVMMQFDTVYAESRYQDYLAGLFSELEETVVIFIASKEEASFWNDKFDYIIPKADVRELVKIIMSLDEKTKKTNCLPSWVSNRLIVKTNKNYHFVKYEDIHFVEKRDKNLLIHTHEETISTRENLSNIENHLPETFIKVHRAFIVNLDHISKIENIGNRSYQVEFYNSDKIAYMSRYKADGVFKIIDCG